MPSSNSSQGSSRRIVSVNCVVLGCWIGLSLLSQTAFGFIPWTLSINTNNVLLVTAPPYNATGDGVTVETTAIQSAINAATAGGVTNGLRGGVVQIPPGTFLCGPLAMKSNVRLELAPGAVLRLLPYGTYPGAPYSSSVTSFISGSGLTNIAVTGPGLIDGQGEAWWRAYEMDEGINRPAIIYLPTCSRVWLQDFTSTNPPNVHVSIKGANAGNVNFIGIKLFAPPSDHPTNPSHNTDGVDFAQTNALFQDCIIDTGDDNIALGSSGSLTRDVLVTNCFFGDGHGLSIGSYTSGGISNLTVVDCTFSNTGNGIKIKSARDRGGIVQNLNYHNITMTNVDWPIQMYPYYEYGLGTLTTITPAFVAGVAAPSPNPSPYNPPRYRNITISNVTAHVPNGRPPLLIWGLPDYPVSNVVLRDVDISSSSTRTSGIYNVTNVQFIDCSFPVPAGNRTFQMWNADVTFTNTSSVPSQLLLNGLTTNGIGSTLKFFSAPATVANTNAIAGGSIWLANSMLTVSNHLALTAAVPLNFVVGTNPALLAVKGNLTLGGVVNVIAGAGFTNGAYPIITYTGSLNGSLPTLGTTPGGFICSLDTNIAGVVRLVASVPAGSLPAPASLSATATNGYVALTWPAVPTATSYNLKRATVNGGPYTTIATLTATSYTDVAVVTGTTYYYVVTALNASEESANSPQASATPSGTIVWSPPWQTQDVGAVGLAGSASHASETFTVTGSGADIQGTADAFRFVYLTVSGDCTITARVATQQNIDQWSKAGVMIRASLAADAANAFVGITPNTANGVTWQYRSTAGGGTSYNKTAGLLAPYWVRLVRTGNTFTGYRSADGITWTQQGTTSITMGATAYVGLAVTSHNNSSLGTATFDNVAMAPQWPVPLSPSVAGVTNQTVIAGNNTSVNAVITGYPVPSLQWRSNSVALAGQTNASLTLNNVQYAQNGTVYSLVANNSQGVVTNSMTLTVLVTPGITGLENQAATTGSNVSIPATVVGVPVPGLQWRFNGNNVFDGATGNGSTIAGATSGTLTINNVQASDSGTYSLVAGNIAGVVTNAMTLTVSSGNVAPFMSGLTDQTVVEGSNATFSASVSGLPLPTLQWRVNGADIPGATNTSLTLSDVQYAQNGFVYSLVASNEAGMATNSASLFVLVPSAISAQPTNLSVVVGNPAVFSVTAAGVPAVRYQWRKNGLPIANATNATYTVSNPQGADNGSTFAVVVSNSVSVVTSSNATLTVLSPMTATFLPTNGAVNIAPDQQLRITFSGGTPKLAYTGKKLYVHDAANNSLFATIDTSQFQTYTVDSATVSNAFLRLEQGRYFYYMPIAVYGNQAWITLNSSNRFAYGKTYYVTCDTGLFVDSTGASFPGITGTNSWKFSMKASGPVTPTASTGPTNITVGLDGAGDFATLQGASDWIPQNNTLRRIITIQPGTYRDNTCFLQNRRFVTVAGATTNRNDVQFIHPSASYGGVSSGTGNAATLIVESSDMDFRNFTLDNQVYVANSLNNFGAFAGRLLVLISTSDRLVFDNVAVKGGQDTYYAAGSGYFRNCELWGSVDFIYGPAVMVFEQCNIVEIRNTGGPITAPNTAYAQPYGMVFLNCTFPRALVANGYPYDVGAANTTFQRAWGQDGMTAIINCAVGSHISTAGWSAFGYGGETTCRAREYGTTLIGGGAASTIAQRQAAGAYWLNTLDPDYTNNPSLNPTNALLTPPTGTNNRVAVTVNPADYTASAVFGNNYFANLAGWTRATIPIIAQSPTNQTVNAGNAAVLSVAASGLPSLSYQWRKNGTNLVGATNATFVISSTKLADNGTYSVTVSNSAGQAVSGNAVLSIPAVPASITPSFVNDALTISWPLEQTGSRLLVQTNDSSVGMSTNWFNISGATNTNQFTVPIDTTAGSIFFRLAYP
jgi:polygalacturonase